MYKHYLHIFTSVALKINTGIMYLKEKYVAMSDTQLRSETSGF